jgi:hypothetical protein
MGDLSNGKGEVGPGYTETILVTIPNSPEGLMWGRKYKKKKEGGAYRLWPFLVASSS